MLTYYQSERLELRILKPDSSSAVLDFYERNRNTLEPVEPLRPQYFYTITYQSRNLTWEYNAFLKSKHIRYWMFRKNSNIPIRGVQLRKHSKAREKRYSFGYAVSFIFACYQILWTFPKSLYLCSRYLLLAYG